MPRWPSKRRSKLDPGGRGRLRTAGAALCEDRPAQRGGHHLRNRHQSAPRGSEPALFPRNPLFVWRRTGQGDRALRGRDQIRPGPGLSEERSRLHLRRIRQESRPRPGSRTRRQGRSARHRHGGRYARLGALQARNSVRSDQLFEGSRRQFRRRHHVVSGISLHHLAQAYEADDDAEKARQTLRRVVAALE